LIIQFTLPGNAWQTLLISPPIFIQIQPKFALFILGQCPLLSQILVLIRLVVFELSCWPTNTYQHTHSKNTACEIHPSGKYFGYRASFACMWHLVNVSITKTRLYHIDLPKRYGVASYILFPQGWQENYIQPRTQVLMVIELSGLKSNLWLQIALPFRGCAIF
jgi:hypothetical protein